MGINSVQEKLNMTNYTLYPWFIFILVTTGTFMVNVDSSILNVALPELAQVFHASPQRLQWVLTSYLLIITGILPTIGKWSDLKGRKIFFVTGVSIFTVSSFFAALATSLNELVIWRVVQGLGGSMIMGNVMSIVADTFPPGQRGRPLGLIGSVVALGTIVGPSIGGVLIDRFGWPSVFWVNVPLGILSAIGSFVFLPSKPSGRLQTKFDYVGSFLFLTAMSSLIIYLSNGSTWGWWSVNSVLLLMVSLLAWVYFIWVEIKLKSPLIELTMFRSPVFTIGNMIGYISFVLMMMPSILFPLFMHDVLSIPVAHIGLIMTSQAVAMIIASPISGWITDRKGSHWISMAGMGLSTLGIGFMTFLGHQTSYTQIIVVLFVFGLGMGLFQSPNNVSVLESVGPDKTGIAGSIIATVRNFGRVSGVTLTVLLLQVFSHGKASSPIHVESMQEVMFVGFILGCFCSFVLLVRAKNKNRRSS